MRVDEMVVRSKPIVEVLRHLRVAAPESVSLPLLCEVVVVLALVLCFVDPNHASVPQQPVIRLSTEGLGPPAGHGIQPFEGLCLRRKEETPSRLERAAHFADDLP